MCYPEAVQRILDINETSDSISDNDATAACIGWPPGTGMVYFGMSPWDVMWRCRHQLMSRFARHMPVLYVEPAAGLKNLLTGKIPLARLMTDIRQPNVVALADQLHVFRSSSCLPVHGSQSIGTVLYWSWLRAVSKAATRIGITRPIIWVSRPEMHRFVGHLGEILSIYHVVDEFTGYLNVNVRKKERLEEREKLTLDKVDLTIAVSPEVQSAKAGPGRSVYLVENAVDISRFEHERTNHVPPGDMASIPRPRFGFCGLISQRLDLELLLELVRQRPAWSFVFFGQEDGRECEAQLTALKNETNTYFLGQKLPQEVPAYIVSIDVGLMPYAINLETRNISPLKMYEYLAAGKPIVSTDIPAARRKENLVAIGENHQDFASQCQAAIDNTSSRKIKARTVEAHANSWDHRIVELSSIIDRHLKGCHRDDVTAEP